MDQQDSATDPQPIDTHVPEDVAAALERARVILAATDDGTQPAYVASRAVAVQLARKVGARLILMDRSAESLWTDPYASGPFTSDDESWSAGEGPLRRNEAEALGRHYLNEQIDVAADAGVEAAAWMPHGSGAGADDLREALGRFKVDAIVVPADPPQHLVERLRGGWLDGVRKLAIDRPLVLVEQDGTARLDTPA
jgi:hypothetical protein